MTTLTVLMPADIKALAEAQAARTGHSVDEYLQALIRADAEQEIGPELEAELLKGLASPAREFSAERWHEKVQRFEERHTGGR